jgi:hypothetical protein
MKSRRITSVCLLACAALLGGLLFTTTAAEAKLGVSFTTIWNHIKPKADARYVKKTDRNKITRVAAVGADSASVPVSSDTNLLTVQIKAPSKGFLVVTANGVYNATPTPLIHCGITIDGDDGWPGDLNRSSLVTEPGAWAQCSVNPAFRVGKGNHTLTYAAHNDGGGSLSFSGGQLNAQFIPFNGQGKFPKVPAPAKLTHGRDIARR